MYVKMRVGGEHSALALALNIYKFAKSFIRKSLAQLMKVCCLILHIL